MNKRLILILLGIGLVGCASINSVTSDLRLGMSKKSLCEATVFVSIPEDPCYGGSKYFNDSNMQIMYNDNQNKFFVFKNVYSWEQNNNTSSSSLVAITSTYNSALKYITQTKKISSTEKLSINTTTNKAPKKSYTSSYSTQKSSSTYSTSSSSGNVYQCNSARSELSQGQSLIRQGKNYENANYYQCNNTSSCLTPLPRQCQNYAYQCRNNVASCRSGDYGCTSRASSAYNSCRSQANQRYNQCQSNARQAAENQRRNCLNNQERQKNQCRQNLRNQANNLINRGNSITASANRKIRQYCN